MEKTEDRETLERKVSLEVPVSVPKSIKNVEEVLDLLTEKFANSPAGLARVDALRALPREDVERWLLARPDAKRLDPVSGTTACVIVVTVTTVTVVVGYAVYKVYNEVLKKWEERKKAITEEKEVKKEKLVCPDDED